jgi:hypothetical protein
MTSWPDHLPSGNQKRLHGDPVKRIGAILQMTFTVQPRSLSRG